MLKIRREPDIRKERKALCFLPWIWRDTIKTVGFCHLHPGIIVIIFNNQ